MAKINWFGFAGGVLTILVIAVSLVYPWWQLRVGDDLMTINASPVNTNFGVLGTGFSIPFILALNIIGLLSLLLSGVAMIIYSVMPAKSFAKPLLDFGYKKPLFTLLFFVIGLLVITVILQTVLSINLPLMGTAISTVPIPFASGTTLSLLLSAGFQWSFWLAAVAAGLCIAARLYHKKVAVLPHA
ncbi:MAG: hypothetical protein R3319_01480 [Candidatus Bathyarchaeia archaeon]|nr:hypothetical protein [Candidatus Bathyarchaeia archaeon]